MAETATFPVETRQVFPADQLAVAIDSDCELVSGGKLSDPRLVRLKGLAMIGMVSEAAKAHEPSTIKSVLAELPETSVSGAQTFLSSVDLEPIPTARIRNHMREILDYGHEST
jgi:hypothetical protein